MSPGSESGFGVQFDRVDRSVQTDERAKPARPERGTASGALSTPRPMPSTLVPLAAGSLVILLALPIYAVAGWRLAGWLLAATLWAASQAFGLLLSRLRVGAGDLGSSGVMAFGMMFRAIAVMIVVLAVAVSEPSLALGAALLYALAYTLELGLSVVAYFSGSPS